MCKSGEKLKAILKRELKKIRYKRGMTQEQMAEKLGISPRSYLELEHGRRAPSTMSLVRFLLLLREEELFPLLKELWALAEEEEGNDVA